jgi:peptidoglycan-associated lipoprotein
MRTATLTLTTVVALAAGCARQRADEAAAYYPDEPSGAADQRADRYLDREAQAGDELPLTVTGVFLDEELVSMCEIRLPPKAYFEFDSADLDLESNRTLSDVATCVTTGPLRGRKLELVGHTDPRGTDTYNKQLGRSRAESVRDFLLGQGLPQANLSTRSVGELDADLNPEEWAYERRVDIRLLPAN